jgi:glutamate-1-semialdehyde 2,1-aminomutase
MNEEKNEDYCLNENDLRCLERIRSRMPDKLFDIHIHIYDMDFLPGFTGPDSVMGSGARIKGFSEAHALLGAMLPSRPIRFCALMVPDRKMREDPALMKQADAFLIRQLEAHPENAGAIGVMNEETEESLEARLVHKGIRGFKCYHVTASRKDTFNADIAEYLSEAVWKTAHNRDMFITLHMVKQGSLSDPENLAYIREHLKRYPRAKLILAHAARGFAPATAIDSLDALSGFDNVYFDTAAVCEPIAIEIIIRRFGVNRVLWGSDYPVSAGRGKCVSLGDDFVWITPKNLTVKTCYDKGMVLVGVENLMAMDYAAMAAGLSKSDIGDIFYNNAVRLLGLE